jgi:hypothetical protein
MGLSALMVLMRLDTVVGWQPRTLGGDGHGLATILIGGAWDPLLFYLGVFLDPKGS